MPDPIVWLGLTLALRQQLNIFNDFQIDSQHHAAHSFWIWRDIETFIILPADNQSVMMAVDADADALHWIA